MDLEHSKGVDGMSGPLAAPSVPPGPKALAALALCLFLGGCGVKPFVDGRREAGQTTMVGVSNPDRVAICYSSQSSSPAEVRALAQAECAKTDRVATFDGQDSFECALLAPARAYFKCVPK